MPLKSLRAWLDVDTREPGEFAPLRATLQALDHLEPDRARYLAAFAYLLGRVAHADQDVSTAETAAMEALVQEHGELSQEQAMLVVQLAKTNNLLFGGTANFLVAREFSELATYAQKLALMRCLFAVSSADDVISTAEESEIHRIGNELRIDHPDLVALRVAHQHPLPGVRKSEVAVTANAGAGGVRPMGPVRPASPEMEEYGDVRWHGEGRRKVETAFEAERFIEQMGFAACLADSRRPGPSLYMGVCGRRDG